MSGLYRLGTIELVCEGFMPAFQMAFWYIMHWDLEEVVWFISQFLKGRVHGFFHRQKFLVRSSCAYPIGRKNFYTWFLSSKNPSIEPAFPLISGVEWRGAGQVRLSFAPSWWSDDVRLKESMRVDRWQSKTRRMASRTTNCAQSIILRIFDNLYLRYLGIYRTKHHGSITRGLNYLIIRTDLAKGQNALCVLKRWRFPRFS